MVKIIPAIWQGLNVHNKVHPSFFINMSLLGVEMGNYNNHEIVILWLAIFLSSSFSVYLLSKIAIIMCILQI